MGVEKYVIYFCILIFFSMCFFLSIWILHKFTATYAEENFISNLDALSDFPLVGSV